MVIIVNKFTMCVMKRAAVRKCAHACVCVLLKVCMHAFYCRYCSLFTEEEEVEEEEVNLHMAESVSVCPTPKTMHTTVVEDKCISSENGNGTLE